MSGTAVKRYFGYYKESADGSVDFTVNPNAWSPAILDEFEQLTEVIFKLQPIAIAYEVVERNYSELLSTHELYVSQLNAAPRQLSLLETIAPFGLVTATQHLTNTLSAASAFLTQTGDRLKRFYGGDSIEFKAWDTERKDFHATTFAYRFLYELRNYSQHMGIPISRLGVEGERSQGGTGMAFQIRLALDRDELLSSSFNWKKLKSEISSLPASFEIGPMLRDYIAALRKLCLSAIDMHSLQLADCARYFQKLHILYRIPEDAIPTICVYEHEVNGPPQRHEQVPARQLQFILTCYDQLLNKILPPEMRNAAQ
ncbi:MAG: hypothetical protein ACXU8N_04500 [Telluria sp.]